MRKHYQSLFDVILLKGGFFVLFLMIGPQVEIISAQVIFRTKVPSMKVLENEMFQITYLLKNAEGQDFQGPDFEHFTVLSKPSRYLDSTRVSRNARGEAIYSYALFPKDTGVFQLPPASIRVKGRRITSNSMRIEVFKTGTVIKPELTHEEAFVQAEVSAGEVFQGQQLVIDYKLYYTVDVQTYYFTYEPAYKGFYKKDTHQFNSETTYERINGTDYTTKIIKRVILFPQQQGRHTIEPMHIRLGVVSNNLFKINRYNMVTNALTIRVNPLATLSRDTLIGAVGKFQMQAQVSTIDIRAGEDLSIKLSIEGNGDIKAVKPPPIPLPDHFEIYPPRIIEESFQENKDGIRGRKLIEYLLIPNEPGNYRIAPEFTYFDTDMGRPVTLKPETFEIRVGASAINSPANKSLNIAKEGQDIFGLKPQIIFKKQQQPLLGSELFYLLSALPILLLGLGIYFRKKMQRQQLAPELLKKMQAKKIADRHLATARNLMNTSETQAFYQEISRATLDYVSDKLDIPRAELSKDRVRRQLQALGAEQSTIDDLHFVMTVTEHILYTGSTDPKNMTEIYQKAENTIHQLEIAGINTIEGHRKTY